MKKRFLLTLSLLLFLADPSVFAQTNPIRVGVTSTTNVTHAGLWIAKEAGLFEEQGLNVELILLNNQTRVAQAVLAEETPIVFAPGTLISSTLAGIDIAIVAGVVNVPNGYLMVNNVVQKPSDLRGKTIGIPSYGSASDLALRYAIKQWELRPDRDLKIVQSPAQSERIAAVTAGAFAGGVVTFPVAYDAQKAGLVVLSDLAQSGLAYPTLTVFSSRRYIKRDPETLRRFLIAYAQGVDKLFREKEFAIGVISKYLRIEDRDKLEAAYDHATHILQRIPEPSYNAINTVLLEIEERNPAAKARRPEQFIDPSIFNAAFEKGVPSYSKSSPPDSKNEGYTTVSVFYGTDRAATGDTHPEAYYGNQRSGVQVGICKVSIPDDHRIGKLENPYFEVGLLGLSVKLGFRWFENPKKHVLLRSVETKSKARFLDELRGKVEKSDKRDAFVFIHGYRNTFEDSCRRTAQIAYDLKFSGAPIMYSWPSDGTVTGYLKDETNIEWSTPNIEQFLLTVAEETGAKTVHLIAHSMGNRALVRALESIVNKRGGLATPIFNQVVLTAADIDAGVFLKVADAVRKASVRTTIYSSSNDDALDASKKVHGYPRLGESGQNITVIEGMDTIDVSTIDTSLNGHSYYGENLSVISDLYELIGFLRPPRDRFHLRERTVGQIKYFEFRP